MEIHTNRFVLRDFSATDVRAFLAYHADPRNSRFYTPEEARPEHAQHLLATFQDWAAEQPRKNYQFAVVQCREPHSLAGCAGLRGSGHPPHEAEFGMELAPDYWGRHAYAVEIGRALLGFGFGNLGLRVITGSTVSANSGITRLAEWFGAEIVATRPAPQRMAEQQGSSLDWRITKERWHQSKSRPNDRNA
ncbi:MAG: GNAT family N-acetyltransferase [Chthoniobacterales bacterium]|nr:GNAT family N-acetyltransferase [Chthoniobacterales bacterium]